MSKRVKVKVGDVFLVPVDGSRFGVGQIAEKVHSAYYMIIFQRLVRDADDLTNVVEIVHNDRVRFASLSLDALLYHKEWPIVTNQPVSARVESPAYQITEHRDDGAIVLVEDMFGGRSRPATDSEAAVLPLHTMRSPMVLELALKADLGQDMGEVDIDLDELRPENIITSEAVFGAEER